MKASLCFDCKKSVPYIKGNDCEWQKNWHEVAGWDATYNPMTLGYTVRSCPKFAPDKDYVDPAEKRKVAKALQKNNSSGYKGVHQDKRDLKWCATISLNGRKFSLGRYENQLDAAIIRKEAEANLDRLDEWYAEFRKQYAYKLASSKEVLQVKSGAGKYTLRFRAPKEDRNEIQI